MEPMYLSIQPKKTGERIRKLLLEQGYTIREIQGAFGFENPQAIYKWLSGKSLPSIDNFIIYVEIIYVFLTIFLYLLKCPQSLILSALRAFCFCGKPHISRSIFLYFRYQSWLKSW